ncbi:hypothetical protein K493DRAFT_336196 [Basidiobolus meristosporus CBS 931.73]|uniref:Uncharacterized protein n=1 Tax=Basidiobolus meristosporus CBS 931.73 TaxID=1314790 RepID=A0A1Y1YK14_9FUNG|nr:hypothetical protein K493DRAFT_336196 [Basidiobolus meristosporus CBS 931.73]|eukprot:ORX98350.1 hypothetical protein K493DRAFT_336196 [Basidiobolus meristosporus CBS 931.73]
MLFRNILLAGTMVISMIASSFAAPLDRDQPSITATPEYAELYKNVKACSEEFLSSLKAIPAGKEVRFAECVKMIQEFTQSLGVPSNSVTKRALDATNGVDVFFDALDRFEQTAKSWENSNLVCGITKQKGGKDICGCNKGYCWRRVAYRYHLSFRSGSEYQICTKDSDCVFDNTNCAKNYCALF